MFVLIMDRETDWYVTLHATSAEAKEAVHEYARAGWVEKQQRDQAQMTGEEAQIPEEEMPRTTADCIEWLEAGGEHVKLFQADPGAGLGEEILL
jgi:hypothetical protein